MSAKIYGTPVVQGVAYGTSAWINRPALPPESAPYLPDHVREDEVGRFLEASDAVANGLFEKASHTDGEAAEVLIMTASMATDRAWTKDVSTRIRSGIPALQAVMAATERFVIQFETAGGLMAERVTDLRDVRDRVLARLQGIPEPGIPDLDTPFILLADDLSPADTAGLDPATCLGIATKFGGPTSHTSIISRQLGIPCIVAARGLGEVHNGQAVLLDATQGTISTGIDEDEAAERVRLDRDRATKVSQWSGPARTADGVNIDLLANVADPQSSHRAHDAGLAKGVGLLRTELAFLKTSVEPSVDEQTRIYVEALEPWAGHKVVIRTLDAGSDKPVPYATLRDEPNPALGVRGIRTTGPFPKVLPNQLDAIAVAAMASPEVDVWVMAPMVSTLSEAEWFVSLVAERNETFGVSLKAGIMIEVPATAILIDQFLEVVDFVSIGTNDLTQYTMATDRESADLAEYSDPWQPAPLALIKHIAQAGVRAGKPVGVCGEAAADPLLAAVLVGMGVTSLSMASGAIAGVGALLADHTLDECRTGADAVIGAHDGADARYRVRVALGLLSARG
ncbi:phosphoenolpyruvate--protein phosphotransferase [Schaalia vaccimaxillae]|uniref:phosphoenolpyruvate--protein phosphotransferase n=1 Tax=Schaalia vaccimaxillae TaxID=183916 RepID=UPI0003B63E50|nr:putative PEP-binding protein [Schaalia vaccimaxillae]